MPSEQWHQRVARAQQMAAQRLGVDVETMLPPRQPSEGGGAEEAVAEAPVEEVAVAEAAPVAQAAVETAQSVASASPAAQRIAEAKAKAAAKPKTNGSAPPAPSRPAPAAKPAAAAAPAAAPVVEGQPGINRREFLTYAWGAAMGLLTLGGGYATFDFLYPRFREGEFGGKFTAGLASSLPAVGQPPRGEPDGKYWLVDTEEGPKALYMVCTHLGCLYKWEPSTFQFECPCHGSKFTVDGHYIEGPADRSLDEFVIEIVHNGEVVSQTQETAAAIVPPTVPDSNAEIVVDTGRRILGRSAATSPARAG